MHDPNTLRLGPDLQLAVDDELQLYQAWVVLRGLEAALASHPLNDLHHDDALHLRNGGKSPESAPKRGLGASRPKLEALCFDFRLDSGCPATCGVPLKLGAFTYLRSCTLPQKSSSDW